MPKFCYHLNNDRAIRKLSMPATQASKNSLWHQDENPVTNTYPFSHSFSFSRLAVCWKYSSSLNCFLTHNISFFPVLFLVGTYVWKFWTSVSPSNSNSTDISHISASHHHISQFMFTNMSLIKPAPKVLFYTFTFLVHLPDADRSQ